MAKFDAGNRFQVRSDGERRINGHGVGAICVVDQGGELGETLL
jgi:hypothetical protein